MIRNKILKLAIFNAVIVISTVFLFSPGFLGILKKTTSTLALALAYTVIIMSVILFLYINYMLIIRKEKVIQVPDIKGPDDIIKALEQNSSNKTFAANIDNMLEQIERLEKKKDSINSILLQKFNVNEMSYSKFANTIKAVEDLFYDHLKSIINKLNAFDEDEYIETKKQMAGYSNDLLKSKMEIYNEYISYIKNLEDDNEEILLKLDRFLLEISKFNSLEHGDMENMNEMKELDDLISKINFYK
ncbi:MAG: hypothetical protein ABRQ25_14300 [Clostridiaceae bacterium]